MTTEFEPAIEDEPVDPATATPALEVIGDEDVAVCSGDACSVPTGPDVSTAATAPKSP